MKPNFLSILLIVYALALQTIFIYYYYFYRENFVTHKARLSSRKNSKTASNSYSTNDNISEFNFPKNIQIFYFARMIIRIISLENIMDHPMLILDLLRMKHMN